MFHGTSSQSIVYVHGNNDNAFNCYFLDFFTIPSLLSRGDHATFLFAVAAILGVKERQREITKAFSLAPSII
jgi:hypothetical protein